MVAKLTVEDGRKFEGVAYNVIAPVGTCNRVTAADLDTLLLPLSDAFEAVWLEDEVLVIKSV